MRLRVVAGRGSSFTTNVGPGGFCTGLMRVLQVGEPVEGMIYFDGVDRSFTGRVVWAKPGDFRMGLMGRMGVMFLTIDPELAKGLAAHGAAPALGDDPGGDAK